MSKVGLILIASLFLGGCATRYQAQGLMGGYREQQQDGNIWKVSFQRNDYTDKELAIDFSLLRCAELTLAKGFSYFGITAVKIGNEHGSITRSKTDTLTMVSNINFTGKPGLTNTIVMLRHKLTSSDAIYDAAELCKSLTEKHGLDDSMCLGDQGS